MAIWTKYGFAYVGVTSMQCREFKSSCVTLRQSPKKTADMSRKYNFQKKKKKDTKKRSQTCSLCTICGLIS